MWARGAASGGSVDAPVQAHQLPPVAIRAPRRWALIAVPRPHPRAAVDAWRRAGEFRGAGVPEL